MGTNNLAHAAQRKIFSAEINKFIRNLNNNPKARTNSYLRLANVGEKFWGTKGADKEKLERAKKALADPNNRWVKYINKVIDETNPDYLSKMTLNLGYEAFFRGTKKIRKNRKKYGCNVPWLILFDPTMACNMHCIGCWSGTYGHKANLTFEDMDKIVTEGKELGVYLYMMTGGEPMVRKADIIKLCEKHNDCFFAAYSNSTLRQELNFIKIF